MKKVIGFTLFFILIITSALAQEYSGKVLDGKSNAPLEGVSIYFDGTTIGTITNTFGNFIIESTKSTEAALVISFLGYKTKTLYKADLNQENLIIFLEVEPMTLGEVIIEEDNWSRAKKWKYFKREFLGENEASKYCKILNPEDIRLRYSKSDNVLYATAKKPILIENKFLGYNIVYNLADFEITFKKNQKFISTYKVLYSGTSQFKELNSKKVKNKYIKAREATYFGSLLHFMRSLANESLADNKFRIYIANKKKDNKEKNAPIFIGISPRAVFKVKKYSENESEITVNESGKIAITYNGLQSGIILEKGITNFKIDGYGLFYPIYALLVSGEFSRNRISSMLPSNYGID